MEPDHVVIVLPGGQHKASMSQQGEQHFVERFISQWPIEAYDTTVLHGFYPV